MKRAREAAHRSVTEEAPRLRPIKGGWAASGNGWAVHGASQEEAIWKFQAAVQQHHEIAARPYWYEVLQSIMRPGPAMYEPAYS